MTEATLSYVKAVLGKKSESRSLHLLGATGKATIEMDGKTEYLVVPVVALMEGVIHAVNAETPEFVPFETLEKCAESWNGKPITIGHPKGSDGKQCSAQDDGIIRAVGIGKIRNAHVDVASKKMLMEALIDTSKAKKLHPDMYQRLAEGGTEEVSVGAMVVTDHKPGLWNKVKKYLGTWTHAEGDHLAFLPGGRGACSVEMGCGTHRAAMRVCEGDMKLETLRDIPQSERDKMSESDFAGPDETYPIKTQADVEAAAHLIGKAKDPAAVKAKVISIAKKKGLKLPDAWMKAASNPEGINQYTQGGGGGGLPTNKGSGAGSKGGIPRGGHTGATTSTKQGDTTHYRGEGGHYSVQSSYSHMSTDKQVPTVFSHTHFSHGLGSTAAPHSTHASMSAAHETANRLASTPGARNLEDGDTTEQETAEESAELTMYQTMRSLWDSSDKTWDEMSTLIDALIADETESPTETPAEEDAEETVETARLESIRALCSAMMGCCQGILSATYSQSLAEDPPTMRGYAGARHNMADTKAIQAVHDHSMSLGAVCDRSNYKQLEGNLEDAPVKLDVSKMSDPVRFYIESVRQRAAGAR